MTQDQIEELKKTMTAIRTACADADMLIADYEKCESDISKKYLSAAIKKHAAEIKTVAELLTKGAV